MFLGLRGNKLLVGITITSGWGMVLFGYDDGVMGSLLSAPSFIEQFDDMNSTLQGAVTGLFMVGGFLGCVASSMVGDNYGRKKVIHVGGWILNIGAVLQAASYGRAQLIVGRIVAGVGFGLVTSRVSIWQSETSPERIRGTLIATSLSFLIIGSLIAYWFEYGLNFASGSIVWRLPMAFQIVISLLLVSFLYFMPESPRWLLEHGQPEQARQVFSALLDKPLDSEEVEASMAIVNEALEIESESQMTWKQIFSEDAVGTRKRFLASFLCQFLQPFSGSTTINYYAATIYENSVHMSRNLALLMSGFTMLWFLIASLGTLYLLERFGRRNMFLYTAFAMGVTMAIFAAMIKVNTQKSGIAATVMLFAYETFYTWGWMGNVWTYPAEILPLGARSKGMSISIAAQYLFDFVILQVTPPGITNIGWKMYLIYMVFNFCFIPIAYFLFPETAGMKLEDIDHIYLDSRNDPIKVANEMWQERRRGITRSQYLEEKAGSENIEDVSVHEART